MIEYIKLPDNAVVTVNCTLCHENADYRIQYNKMKGKQIYFYVCEHCANKILNDIRNGNVREKFVKI